jgi:hypothetical protein
VRTRRGLVSYNDNTAEVAVAANSLACDGKALALPATDARYLDATRGAADEGVSALKQAEKADGALDFLVELGSAKAVKLRNKGDSLTDGEIREEVGVLRHVCDLGGAFAPAGEALVRFSWELSGQRA